MDLPCVTCGAPTARDGWCPSCLTPATTPVGPTFRPPQTLGAPVTTYEGRRNAKSSLTFGPVGRVLWTIGIIAPPALILWWTELWAGFGFAALWWGVVTPWALRDLWRSGRRRRVL